MASWLLNEPSGTSLHPHEETRYRTLRSNRFLGHGMPLTPVPWVPARKNCGPVPVADTASSLLHFTHVSMWYAVFPLVDVRLAATNSWRFVSVSRQCSSRTVAISPFKVRSALMNAGSCDLVLTVDMRCFPHLLIMNRRMLNCPQHLRVRNEVARRRSVRRSRF